MTIIEESINETIIKNITQENDIEDIYYTFGEYIYNFLKPEITTDLDMFKYILGKFYLESLFI